MSSGSALSLVFGILVVGAYYFGAPDSHDWLLIFGTALLVSVGRTSVTQTAPQAHQPVWRRRTTPTTRLITLTLLSAVLAVTTAAVPAEEAPFVVPPIETYTIASKHVDQAFQIYIQLPVSLEDGSERFPVLYLTDSTGGLSFAGSISLMQLGGDVERFILVGIGYPAENRFGGMSLRNRDLTPTEYEPPIGAVPLPIRGVAQVESGKRTGGAAEFLAFIREELRPFIDAYYPTIPGDRGYWGDSLGGLFGLYVMFNQPETFNRYILGSPSVWWDDEVILEQAKAFAGSGKRLDARVFMAVGALEDVGAQAAPPRMVRNLFRVEAILRKADIQGLELTTQLIPDESHTSVIALVRGLQAVYDKPEIPFLEKYMMEQMSAAAAEEGVVASAAGAPGYR